MNSQICITHLTQCRENWGKMEPHFTNTSVNLDKDLRQQKGKILKESILVHKTFATEFFFQIEVFVLLTCFNYLKCKYKEITRNVVFTEWRRSISHSLQTLLAHFYLHSFHRRRLRSTTREEGVPIRTGDPIFPHIKLTNKKLLNSRKKLYLMGTKAPWKTFVQGNHLNTLCPKFLQSFSPSHCGNEQCCDDDFMNALFNDDKDFKAFILLMVYTTWQK